MENVTFDDYNTETLIKRGKRLKGEAQARGIKNPQMAKIIGYSDGRQVSPIYSGKKPLTDDRYEILSKEWGVRVEFLKCDDNYRTDADCLAGESEQRIKTALAAIEYLRSIGMCVKLGASSELVPARMIYDSSSEAGKKMFLDNDLVKEQLSLFNGDVYAMLNHIDDVYEHHYTITKKDNSITDDQFLNDIMHINDDPIICFYVEYNEKGRWLRKQEFFDFIDNVSKTAAFVFETFL